MTEVKRFEIFSICFDHSEMDNDETEFDVELYQDKEDTITELMNLFADFVNESHYEQVHNISVVSGGIYDRI